MAVLKRLLAKTAQSSVEVMAIFEDLLKTA